MLLYQGTGVTKTPELVVTRPIESLMIMSDRNFSALTNETISIFIEKANGNNVELDTNIRLIDFVASSVYGESAVIGGQEIDDLVGWVALCELTDGGAIRLEENESIKISLTGLIPGSIYKVNGIESPVFSDTVVKHDRKVLNTEDEQRSFDVSTYDLAVIDNVNTITEIRLAYNNGVTVKHTAGELFGICFDWDNIETIENGLVAPTTGEYVVLPLVGVDSVEIIKASTGKVTLTCRDSDVNY